MKIRLSIMAVLVMLAAADLLFSDFNHQQVLAETEDTNKGLSEEHVKVILQLFYLDGKVKEEIVSEKITKIDDLWGEYKDWNLVDINTEHIILKKDIQDISPLLKANGYFGLLDDGTLTIFNGKPEEQQIIHSFYQIDMEKLESRELEQLKNGIPIKTKSEFQRILNAFKVYSRTANQ